MSTLLSLVQDVGRDTGTLPSWHSITTLVGASERALKIASWVNEAWTNIQNEEQSWFWMRAEFSHALVIGQTRYTASDLGVSTRWGSWTEDSISLCPWSIYDNSIGVADEGPIRQIDYEFWYRRYARGTQTSGRPVEYALSPAGEFCVGPKPDKAYILRGMYTKSPQVLSADADTPELPVQFHPLVKWEAIRLLQISDEAIQPMQIATGEYSMLRSRLSRQQLPEVELDGEPLA
jgi:hypothetical protein